MKKVLGLVIILLIISCSVKSLPSLSDFSFIDIGMSYDDIVERVGEPDRDVGSGVYLFVYDLNDGGEIMLSFISLESLQAVYHYEQQTEDCSILLGDANGPACGLNTEED
jgi:hypothetical protein